MFFQKIETFYIKIILYYLDYKSVKVIVKKNEIKYFQ